MSAQENLIRSISAGAVIKPWIMLGAYNLDVSERVVGLTYFEAATATEVGRTLMDEALGEARTLMVSRPREGEAAAFMGHVAHWNLVRGPEEYLSWGTYNIKNHLGAAFLSTILVPKEAGLRRWRLLTRIYERALVAINGLIVFDSANERGTNIGYANEFLFEAPLASGENRVNVALLRVGRMAQVGFRLECDTTLEAHIPLPEGLALPRRLAVENEVGSIRFERDLYYPEHAVGFKLGSAEASATPDGPHLTVELFDPRGALVSQVQPTAAGMVTLCQGADLPDHTYNLVCTWKLPSGQPLTATSFLIRKITPVVAPLGYDKLDERRRIGLQYYADSDVQDIYAIWRELARYALGQYDKMNMEAIRQTCLFIAARKDCSDFVIQAILRLLFWERLAPQPRLSPEMTALMKDTVLGFKYWVDEPGDTVMYMGSENHRLLFHVAEWMAGLLYPTENFTNSNQNGLFHTQKAYVYLTEWLRQRGRYGFDEWHSNSYMPVCIAPLLNVYDFCLHEGQYKLQQMTRAVLDQIFFYLAADSFDGFWGTTHGRSYGIYIKYADFDATAPCTWLLYGTGSLSVGACGILNVISSGMAPVCLASSKYRPPELFYDIAHDRSSVVEARQRQGILRTENARHADFVVYRTPDYLLSGLQDHRKGEFESSTHIAQITLANKAQIFFSCPHTTGEGSGLRPDYWSGHTVLPRLVQYRHVMALTWRLSPFAWMSHCWLEPARFDEVRLEGNWAFARSGNGYVGIYSQHGLAWGEFGQYAGRELQCPARENTWLVECGRQADWGSFEAFSRALLTAKIEEVEGNLCYHSPSIGAFVTGWEVKPTVAGKAIQLHGYPLYDSPWAHADFGAGALAIHYGEQEYEIWFNQ